MVRNLKKILILLFLIAFLVGCTQQAVETTTGTDSNQGAGTPTAAKGDKADYSVDIANSAFSPAALEIGVGDKVKWTNKDGVLHTVSFSDETILDKALKNGDSAIAVFNEAGTFAYKCKIHPSMTGTITVK